MQVGARLERHRAALSPAERRVARVVLDDPESVAFGTVAEVARRAGASGATVVRLGTRLGYDGFVGLQGAVRQELSIRLQRASDRIRRPAPSDVIGRTLRTELDNVQATLEAVDPAAFSTVVARLAQRRGRVAVLAGEASAGVAATFAAELGTVRPGVGLVGGSDVAVARAVALLDPGDLLVVLDLPRYDRAVLAAARLAGERGVEVVALTDGPLSPLAAGALVTFPVLAEGAGPFDSQVGLLALANALVSGVAAQLRSGATERLDRVEAAWHGAGALAEG